MMRKAIVLLIVAGLTAGWAVADGPKTFKKDGLIHVHSPEVPEDCRNTPWPDDLEKGFWKRANHAIDAHRAPAGTATTGEHEKWNYPKLMFNILTGDKQLVDHGVKGLQAGDQEARHHKGTNDIDYYWCFTLKGQARKYFYFGDMLADSYRRKMFIGAKAWTAEDPKPTLELYRQLDHPDPAVREYALQCLQAFFVPRDQLSEVLDKSKYAPFKAHMAQLQPKWPQKAPTTTEGWTAWCKTVMDGGWQVYEEYERIRNPRPHPVFGHGTGPIGGAWDPQTRGLWVDGRNTDNLRAMRETTTYLMAEETGNEMVRKLYKDKIKTYVRGLYSVGMGEWDSETYHGHTMAPYLNLYDFAKDKEVKRLAKAALDWLSMAAALKYYRGGYGGPTKRDYGGSNAPFGAGITHLMYLYFGDAPMEDPDPHYDDVHAIVSSYRPPLAVAKIARREFKTPVEMHNTKPDYSHWRPGYDETPQFWTTLFIDDGYTLGSVVAKGGAGDVGAMKLMAYNDKTGVDYFLANTNHGRGFNSMVGDDQRAQYRNLMVWLRKSGSAKPMVFQVPAAAAVEMDNGLWFIGMEKTYIALRPIGLAEPKPTGQVKRAKLPRGTKGYEAKPTQKDGVTGFAMEVGTKKAHGSFEAFRKAVASKGKVDLSKLGAGTVTLTGTDGRVLQATYNTANNLPAIVRDGRKRDWAKEFALYKTVSDDGQSPLVDLGWKDGTLTIQAGGARFTQTVAEDGTVTFKESN